MNSIVISNLKKLYNTETVLEIDDLRIMEGEIVAILGKNGSGKSTLVKIISGLLYQDTGEISVFDIDNKDKKMRNITKFVQESGKGYYDYLTSLENIRYFLGLNKIKMDAVKVELEDLINRFEFGEHLDKKVSELSQGNRQKLSIIISLLTDPKVLLLDEPTNGLDLVTSDFLLNNLKKISNKKNRTIILTTHDLAFIKNLDVRCIILKDGLIIADDYIYNLIEDKGSKKYKIVIPMSDLNSLEELKIDNIRYAYDRDRVVAQVYEEDDKDLIVKNLNIQEFYSENLDIEDIYYRVISYE
ncbi:ABC transporter ATP-binding protein [Alkaliphilus sp. B6464]|uniref:ABC transporter ATP-binding protein n=1 Tax=Alkaliphilus sp. B6464 TaxID=2731219 RepID=UPI001BAB917A|nr:ABC transporter ATP-binding protein [Alkaliphilus sp. B6464]QUH18871.1 ABC transporter ATP-binding protein [Alkaliphilus sp. B6464]